MGNEYFNYTCVLCSTNEKKKKKLVDTCLALQSSSVVNPFKLPSFLSE
jgi:hypothetical protein